MPSPLPQQWRHDSYPINGYAPPVQIKAPIKAPTKSRRILLHATLLCVTLVTTTIAGTLRQGADPLADPTSLLLGLPFAATLMSILLFHEMGHYVVARLHGV